MTSLSSSATPKRDSHVHDAVAHHVDIVWGAPSDEMLEAEARGDIILIEDIYESSIPTVKTEHRTSGS